MCEGVLPVGGGGGGGGTRGGGGTCPVSAAASVPLTPPAGMRSGNDIPMITELGTNTLLFAPSLSE